MATLASRQPASQQLPGVAGLALEWLQQVHPAKFHEVIQKRDGESWKSCSEGGWTLDHIAKAVASPDLVIGIRSEKDTRIVVFDIDKKSGFSSCYWDALGDSPALNRLKEEIERIGCAWSMTRSSSSGGLHLQVTLPEAIHTWKAHWVGRVLALRSGIALEAGQAELFPSRVDYSTEGRQRSHGVRLPGQEGSALILGRSVIEGGDLIYKQLLCDLDETEANEEWERILEAAVRLSKAEKVEGYKKPSVKLFNLDVEWTGPGQSQANLMKITRWIVAKNPGVTCPSTIGQKVQEAAISTPGFLQFASRETQQDLARKNGGLGERMARSFLKRVFSGVKSVIQKLGGDPERNERLFKQSQDKLRKAWIETCEAGEDPRKLSQRKVAILTGLNRKTVIHHWSYWLSLLDQTPPITVCALDGSMREGKAQEEKTAKATDKVVAEPVGMVALVENGVDYGEKLQDQSERRCEDLRNEKQTPPGLDFCDLFEARSVLDWGDGLEELKGRWLADLTPDWLCPRLCKPTPPL